jgi:glutamate racemase
LKKVFDHQATRRIAQEYLNRYCRTGDTLVLGCTITPL